MLKLENVNKYFNRHKKNEIHVINDTSLEFGKTGLIALLGPSGCGKTTLLNAIGGLDKVNSGNIYINGLKMPKRMSYKKDKMRVLNVGYIFQNYNLLESLSVYENVALSLKMIGIKNKNEIKNRVDYILESVGMYRYRNKPAGMLSGGEKQRVGIARALVKNPSIIIADEPTGNLDSKNTIEIMNIIKAISKTKLVILVTHEKDLAHFYASQIVNIEDGKITSNKENDHENELDYRIDNKIYLKDFKNHEKIDDKVHNLDFYSDDKDPIDLDIVIKNGNIYIKSNNIAKIEIVDENSSIELIDDHYKKISKNDYENTDFDLKELDNSKMNIHYSSIYNVFSMLKSGITKVFNYTIMKKILLIGFFISSMFIVYAVSNIFGVTNIKDSNFVTINKNYIQIENSKNNLDDFLALEKDENIEYIIPGNSNINMDLITDSIYQLTETNLKLGFSLASTSLINKEDIILGKMPEEENEMVVDKSVIDNVQIYNENFKMAKLKNYEDFLNQRLKVNNMPEFKIVGITDTKSPSAYINPKHFTNLIANSSNSDYDYDYNYNNENNQSVKNYELFKNDIDIKKGHEPREDYEIIVNINNQDLMPLNKTIDTKINDKKLKVVGYYSSNRGDNSIYASENTVKINNIVTSNGMMIYSKDKENTIKHLQELGYNAYDTYSKSKENYIKGVKDSILQSVIIAGILLAISFVEIFLMIRASFLSRIKEVGIYRAIGVKKTDIYKMFLGEIIVITTLAGVPGFILMSLILNEFTKIKYLKDLYMINPLVLLISLILIFGLNIIIGLLPIKGTIRKTPAEILSRNDVD